jgi:hypothetical protein
MLSLASATMIVAGRAEAQMPAAIAASGEATVVTLHAEGVQVYECKGTSKGSSKGGSSKGGGNKGGGSKADGGKLAWVLREPIATLLLDGKTAGRHYAGPRWEHIDGSAAGGKVVATAPGATPGDIPWLRLQATARKGQGTLSGVTTVQRINTHGGVHAGPCDKAGTFHSVPYSADYVFLQKGG